MMLQGVDIIQEVDVRTRFFEAEGGESLGTLVKDVDELASQLLVASPTGNGPSIHCWNGCKKIRARYFKRLQQGERVLSMARIVSILRGARSLFARTTARTKKVHPRSRACTSSVGHL